MMTILQTSLFWFFAIIGFCEIVRRLIRICMTRQIEQDTNMLLTVKNEEDHIEDKIRSLIFSCYQRKEGKMPHIIIVDLDSTDHTFAILEKLAKEYSFLYPMTKESYLDYCRKLTEG